MEAKESMADIVPFGKYKADPAAFAGAAARWQFQYKLDGELWDLE